MRKLLKSNRSLLLILSCLLWCCEAPEDTGAAVTPINPQIAARTSKVSTLPVYEDASFAPRWLTLDELEKTRTHTIPEFSLMNQAGESVTNANFDGKIYIADFFFTTCMGICLDMTKNMVKLQTEFNHDKDVLFMSHTVTPGIDTPEVLAAYGQRHGVNPDKWHLVTGDRAAIYDLGRRHYFVEEDLGIKRDDDEFLHTENFLLIDGSRRIRGIYNGLKDASLAQLVADVRTLQREERATP